MNKKITRRHERSHVVRVLTVDNPYNTAPAGKAAMTDISASGIAFESDVDFDVGSPVVMRISITEKEFFNFEGVVRRLERDVGGIYIYGVEFTNMTMQDKKQLKKLISILKKEQRRKK